MSHEIGDIRYEGAFEALVCPVCGCGDWITHPGSGTYCDDCNLKVELRATTGDPGFVADFDADHCLPSHWDDGPTEEWLIPESDKEGRFAYAKFMNSAREKPDDPTHGLYWLCVFAHEWEDKETDWRPAWEREDADTTGPDSWNPFFGHLDADDERTAPAESSSWVATVDDDDGDGDADE